MNDIVEPVKLSEKFGRITETWKPKNIAQVNDYHIKAAKLEGEFVWHAHLDTDELFYVHRGELVIRLRDGSAAQDAQSPRETAVRLGPGELYVVPRGVEHCPVAGAECEVLLIEPAGTVNTGDAGGDRTAPHDDWI